MNANDNEWKAAQENNVKHLALWTFAWLVTMAIASFGPKLLWDFNIVFSIIAILVNLSVGVVMVLANIRYIKGLDELERKISIESMGIALGVAIVGGLAYSLTDIANVISSDAEISYLVMAVGITYLLGVLLKRRNYQ